MKQNEYFEYHESREELDMPVSKGRHGRSLASMSPVMKCSDCSIYGSGRCNERQICNLFTKDVVNDKKR